MAAAKTALEQLGADAITSETETKGTQTQQDDAHFEPLTWLEREVVRELRIAMLNGERRRVQRLQRQRLCPDDGWGAMAPNVMGQTSHR